MVESSVANEFALTLSKTLPRLIFVPSSINKVKLCVESNISSLKPFFYEYTTENDEYLHDGTYSEHDQYLCKLDRNHFNTLPEEIDEMLLLSTGKS